MKVNLGAYFYDDDGPLEVAARNLQRDLETLPGPVVVVAYSMGALLPAYVGSNDRSHRLAHLAAVYLNPLIGGSRYADADRLLAVLGEVPGLQWLYDVKRVVLRLLFAAAVRDLAPESEFQQSIFGCNGTASSFADRTCLVFTEVPGAEIDVRADRTLKLFGHPRGDLLRRLGTPVTVDPAHCLGHRTPLTHPQWVTPLLESVVAKVANETPPRVAGSDS